MFKILLLIFVNGLYCLRAECVGGIFQSGVSTPDRKLIVDMHNKYRMDLAKGWVANQPRAQNLRKMRYNTKLALAAQNAAFTCVFEYVTPTIDEWSTVGENIFMTMSAHPTRFPEWSNTLKHWWKQHESYYYNLTVNIHNRHYVQMIWATANYIGCGFVAFPTEYGHMRFLKYYVCFYAPMENLYNDSPYNLEGICGSSLCL